VTRHSEILSGVGLPITYNRGTFIQLLDAMRIDKKARGAKLRFIVLEDIAKPNILEDPDSALLIAAYNKLGQSD
jgi:3-dehydroquinate synthase